MRMRSKTCSRTRICRVCSYNPASSLAGAAPVRTGFSIAAPTGWVSIGRIGRLACRWFFRTFSISRACAPGKRRSRRIGASGNRPVTEAVLTVTGQQKAAAALLHAARAVAANTPIQLAAAQQSERQARARYDAGLVSIIEVADAQSLLAQAEVQDQLARVDVWRAHLAAAVAQGELAPFVNLVRQP